MTMYHGKSVCMSWNAIELSKRTNGSHCPVNCESGCVGAL